MNSSMSESRKLSATALNKLSKNELIKLIQENRLNHQNKPTKYTLLMQTSMPSYLPKLKSFWTSSSLLLRSNLTLRIEDIESTINTLQKENKTLTQSVRDLETKLLKLESNSRKGNFVLKGIPEDTFRKPEEAVHAVGQAIDVQVDIKSCYRLGKPRIDNSPRPILVKSTEVCASNILRSAKKTKARQRCIQEGLHRQRPSSGNCYRLGQTS